MSLIFKALKKLKAQPPQDVEGKEDLLRKSANVYSFSRIFFSPLVLLLVFITGLFIYYGSQLLISYFHQNSQSSLSSTTANSQAKALPYSSQKNDPKMSVEKLEIPPYPEDMPAADLQAATPNAPSVFYLPPDPMDPATNDNQLEYIGKEYESTEMSSLAAGSAGQEFSPVKGHPLPSYQQKTPGVRQDTKTVEKSITVEGLQTSTPSHNRSKQEILLQAKIEKSVKIDSLISSIEKSIKNQQYDQTQKLINELSKLTAKDNSYLLKIKSFLFIKTNQYDQADEILQRILIQNKNDFQANINMAILEIKTGKLEAAHLRLVNLAKHFPENTTIQDLIHKLN